MMLSVQHQENLGSNVLDQSQFVKRLRMIHHYVNLLNLSHYVLLLSTLNQYFKYYWLFKMGLHYKKQNITPYLIPPPS
jgi:hypothetical protein